MNNILINRYSFLEGGFASIQNNVVYRNKTDDNLDGLEPVSHNWKSLVPLFPYHRLYLVTNGNATFKLTNSHSLNLEKDYMYLIPPFTVEAIENNATISHYYLHFKPESSLLNPFECYNTLQSIPCGGHDRELFKVLLNNYQRGSIEADMLSHGCFFMMLSKFITQNTTQTNHTKMLPIIKYIDENIHHDLSLNSIAAHFGYSASYFSALFSSLFHVPYIKYITDKKILIAKRLLALKDISLGEVAQQLGYDDESYFNTLFKRYTGMSPGKWRNHFLQQQNDIDI